MKQRDDSMLVVSPAPHIHAPRDTASIMLRVLGATVPAQIFALAHFGLASLALIAASAVLCASMEAVTRRMLGRAQTARDLSAAVTGVLIAFCLPPDVPLWMLAAADFFAIVIVKQLFGGLGSNFVNPAAAGVLALQVSYSGMLFKGDSPLELWNNNLDTPGLLQLFAGTTTGNAGEVSAVCLLLAAVFLALCGISDPAAPAVYIASVAAAAALMGFDPAFHVLAGGTMLTAAFMVCDPVTTPATRKGRVIFSAGCGILTMIIRIYSSYPDGALFAVMLMNILTPYIDRYTEIKPLMAGKEAER